MVYYAMRQHTEIIQCTTKLWNTRSPCMSTRRILTDDAAVCTIWVTRRLMCRERMSGQSDRGPDLQNILRFIAFSALTLLVGRQEGHPACKKTEWWGAGVVICLELGADLHMAQLMPLPLTVSCFSKIQIGFTFLVPAHPGSPGQRAIKRVKRVLS